MFLTFTIAKIINSIVLLFLSMYYFCGRNGKEYTRQGFGSHNARTTPRATRYTLKISKGKITATMPPGRWETYDRFYHGEQTEINQGTPETSGTPFDQRADTIASHNLPDTYLPDGKGKFLHALRRGNLAYRLSLETCFEREEVQSLLKSMLEKAFRHEAKRLLPNGSLGWPSNTALRWPG